MTQLPLVVGLCSTAAATVIGLMLPDGIQPTVGWPLLAVFLAIAIGSLLYGWSGSPKAKPMMFVVIGLLLATLGIVVSAIGTWRLYHQTRAAPQAQQHADARNLTDTQRKKLASGLIDQGVELDKISMRFSSHGGDEAREYAEEIAQVLRGQGWSEDLGLAIDDDHRLTGLKLWYQPGTGKDPSAARLADALEVAGIDFDWTPHEPPYEGAVLFVYRRP